MKLRLLSVLVAATALSGCASYDYAGGGAGGYYHGRPSADYYGGYAGYGGYGTYGYGGYAPYGYRHGGSYYRYYGYGGYNPYYPYPRYYVVRPPHDDRDDDDDHHHDDDPRGERPPPWRAPDGRYRDTGSVMVPPRNRALPQSSTPSRVLADPSRPMTAPRSMTAPQPMAAPRPSAPPPQRAAGTAQSERPAPRPRQESGVRDEEN